MRKSRTIILLTLLVCLNFTGCGAIDKWKESVSNRLDQSANAKMSNNITASLQSDSMFAMSAKTKNSMSNLLDANEELISNNANWQAAEKLKEEHPVQNFFAGILPGGKKSASQWEKATILSKAEAQSAQGAYENDKASDKLFQKSKQQVAEQDKTTFLKRYGKYLTLALVAIVVIIIIMLLKKKPEPKPVPVVEVVDAEVVDVPKEVQRTGYLNAIETQRSELKALCDEYGVRYDDVVAVYGDDTEGISRAQVKVRHQLQTNGSEGFDNFLLEQKVSRAPAIEQKSDSIPSFNNES